MLSNELQKEIDQCEMWPAWPQSNGQWDLNANAI